MNETASELTPREQESLAELGLRLQEQVPALTAAWERTLDDLLGAEGIAARKELRQECLAAAYELIYALSSDRPAEGWERGRTFGEAMAQQGLSHRLLGEWLSALRQSLLTALSQMYADDRDLEQVIVSFSKFFALYMMQVTETFSGRQQHLLLEQQEALRQSYEQAQRQVVELQALNEVSRAISSTVDLDDLMELIYEQTSRLMDTTSFYVALCDWEQGQLDFVLRFENGERQPPSERPIDVGLTGYIARTGESIFCPIGTEHFHREKDIALVGQPAVSWLGVPMLVQERVVGVIAVQSYTSPGVYDDEHHRILLSIASQAGVAVENARLYQEARRRAEEMEALYRIGTKAGLHLSLEEVLQLVYEQAGVVMDTGAFYVALYDRENDEITFDLDYEKGERREPIKVKKGGLTGWVLDHGESLLVRDWSQDASEEIQQIAVQVGEPARSWLGVPLVVRGETIGVIATQSFQAGAFDEHHRKVLEMIAHQAASAIENVRLYQEAQRRVTQLSAMQRVGLKLATARDVSEMLDAVAESAMDLLRPDHVLIYLYEASRQAFTKATGLRHDGERGVVIPMPRQDGLTATVARTGEAAIVEDVPAHPLFVDDPEQAGDLRSIASIPLVRAGEVLGVINVAYLVPHQFAAEEVGLLQSFADQAAVAVANAQLFQRMQAMMGELQETSETQSQLLHLVQDLSTPVIPLMQNVLLMPLVGSIDSQRGRQILERLLEVAERQRAQIVLLDITGVPVVDTAVAQILLQAVHAVRMLGGEAVLVGIRPEVAQTLVGLGVSLTQITTRSDLQGGLVYAIRQIRQKRPGAGPLVALSRRANP